MSCFGGLRSNSYDGDGDIFVFPHCWKNSIRYRVLGTAGRTQLIRGDSTACNLYTLASTSAHKKLASQIRPQTSWRHTVASTCRTTLANSIKNVYDTYIHGFIHYVIVHTYIIIRVSRHAYLPRFKAWFPKWCLCQLCRRVRDPGT